MALSPGGRYTAFEADFILPSNVEVKNGGVIYSLSLIN
jgi:hypothetical protein